MYVVSGAACRLVKLTYVHTALCEHDLSQMRRQNAEYRPLSNLQARASDGPMNTPALPVPPSVVLLVKSLSRAVSRARSAENGEANRQARNGRDTNRRSHRWVTPGRAVRIGVDSHTHLSRARLLFAKRRRLLVETALSPFFAKRLCKPMRWILSSHQMRMGHNRYHTSPTRRTASQQVAQYSTTSDVPL